ncbi:MAG: NAD-dependent epimerase/dehydratase family protein [Stackebrandtia sp.]
MRILVTGGAGFIGSHIVTAARAAGHDVSIADALLTTAHGSRPHLRDRHMMSADVRDRGAMRRALKNVDVVCHQAAMVGLGNGFTDACDYVDCNDLGTAALLSAMADAGVRHLVLAGSMVVYGEGVYHCVRHGEVRPAPRLVRDLDAGRFEPPCPHCGQPLSPGLVDEGATVDPRNVYAATKMAQEYLAAAWARSCGGRAISLRYHNVYGPGMPRDTPYAGVASFFRSAVANGESPRVFEDGRQRRDFVNVRDVAAANLTAVDAVQANIAEGLLRSYNVASGTPHTVGDLAAELAARHSGPEPEVTGEYRLGDVRHITASIARITSELGWRPTVGFSDGVAEFATAPLREATT